jgi:class 3 adenylate cyclase/DNA-binding response OmpR family regulator
MSQEFHQRPCILIAEDEEEIMNSLIIIIQDLFGDIEIIKAENGRLALKAALEYSPDLILTDWEMPIMNGLELLCELKGIEQTVDIPVIMSTSFQSPERLAEALMAGAVDYIRKPCDPFELQARLYSALMLSRAYQKLKYSNEQILRQQKILEEQAAEIQQINKSLQEINASLETEKAKSDGILKSVLPEIIVQRLKNDQSVNQQFQSVSILFADLVGFTVLSMQLKPEIMFGILRSIFGNFDRIIQKYGGFRMRTMGDGYFAVIGAPIEYEDHARRMANAALEMMEQFAVPEEYKQHIPQDSTFAVRIGLNSGPVTAGIIGVERLQYDIYGDTVNTASRMESHGVPGSVHCSPDFADQLLEYSDNQQIADNNQFNIFIPKLVPRGTIEVKGKGEMNTYFLRRQE